MKGSWLRPTGLTLAFVGGLLIAVGLSGDGSSSDVEKEKPVQVSASPDVGEPAWVHTCVGLPTDTNCPDGHGE